MAIKLGNMLENKQKLENIKINEHNRKLEQLKNLIKQCEPIVESAKDIYDTFYYVEHELNDKEFSKRLWHLLCHSDIIDINSYFGFEMQIYERKKHCDVGISRYGVCIYRCEGGRQVHTASPIFDINQNDKETWRGKCLLADYISENNVTTAFLDDAISTLEYFIDNFQNYAEKFFEKVSQYDKN